MAQTRFNQYPLIGRLPVTEWSPGQTVDLITWMKRSKGVFHIARDPRGAGGALTPTRYGVQLAVKHPQEPYYSSHGGPSSIGILPWGFSISGPIVATKIQVETQYADIAPPLPTLRYTLLSYDFALNWNTGNNGSLLAPLWYADDTGWQDVDPGYSTDPSQAGMYLQYSKDPQYATEARWKNVLLSLRNATGDEQTVEVRFSDRPWSTFIGAYIDGEELVAPQLDGSGQNGAFLTYEPS